MTENSERLKKHFSEFLVFVPARAFRSNGWRQPKDKIGGKMNCRPRWKPTWIYLITPRDCNFTDLIVIILGENNFYVSLAARLWILYMFSCENNLELFMCKLN